MIWFKSCCAMEDIGVANIRSIDMNLLCVFDALFDERSVTRAAGRLSVAQPTVSGMLQRLRLAFSDQLFVRSSHGILPTPRAEALAGPIKDLLANAQLLVREEAFDPAAAEGTIKLCGSDYLQHAVIAPLITELRQRAPQLKALVSPRPASGVADLMARGEIDLCFSLRELADPRSAVTFALPRSVRLRGAQAAPDEGAPHLDQATVRLRSSTRRSNRTQFVGPDR
jgi:DNA-binding transcriptional LysR family regulator